MWAVSQVCGTTSLWSTLGLFASREEERRYNMQRSETECSKHLKVSTAATLCAFHAVFLIFFITPFTFLLHFLTTQHSTNT